ncbi:heavy metal translocating P-type ATPase [Oceanicella actignis]|uniref:P-type Cu(2+) transporter n=1 Tax=Oceanicella actignis TaxID=1189325 RepID=A0A1M7T2H0_9RHOB|nr:heavy metal translocating P-type ATPase [Oceanicella actignis]SET39246.1 Cu+-exporting ATPase [Oceanicella actignis]SHN64955.1 Cu+-exporting ATPase [Oceanicella actignis]
MNALDDQIQGRREAAVSLEITGMTCAGCARRVESALREVEGVRDAQVNLALERADIDGAADPAALVEAVRKAGFGVRLAQTDLAIRGMTCAGCAATVEKALRRTPGVIDAAVNLATESATVRHLPHMAGPAELMAAVKAAGYDAAPAGARDHDAAEAAAARRRDVQDLALALLLAAPLAGQMVLMALGFDMRMPVWAELALATPVQLWAGRRFHVGAARAIRAGAGNMDVLVSLGSWAAYLHSLWLVATQGEGAAGHLYFEASAVIIALVLLGKTLENRAKRAASAALRELMSLRPETAHVLIAGKEHERPVDAVGVGDVLVVRPGERIPVDGVILRGETELDESLITGESMPVRRGPGDVAPAGALNGPGLIRIRAERVGRDTTLARIAELVAHAQTGKAPVQRLVDRVSAVFVPVVMALAALTFGGWLAASVGFEHAFRAAVSVLVIACPCALGLATPTALVAGTGAAARAGILIRDIETLERAARLDVIVFDKTGTLTEGAPRLTALAPAQGLDENALLLLAASAQLGSEHPLGKAMARAARERGLEPEQPDSFEAVIGAGVIARVGGRTVRIGTRALVEAEPPAELAQQARAWTEAGATVVWIADDGAILGVAALEDALRADAPATIARLRARGLRTMLLTGDNAAVARRVARRLGIDDVAAEVRPEHKAQTVADLRKGGRRVAMVGDGVNDAPALAAADVGIAMGSGADAAREAAGITLMRPRLMLVADALDVAAATARKIRQNLFWAFAYNVVCLPIAAAGLLNPAIAGAAMAMSSVSVVTNALTLRRWRPEADRPMDRGAA